MISVTWTGIISIGKDNTDFDITYLPWFTTVCLHHADLISEQFIAIPQFFELRPPPTPPKKTTTFMSDVECAFTWMTEKRERSSFVLEQQKRKRAYFL